MSVTSEQRLDDAFAALANSTRRAILARLADGEASVNELAEPFELSLPAVSRHIRVLERAGLVSQGRRAQFRPCRIDPAPLRDVADWTERYRPIWEARFDRLADYVDRVRADHEPHDPQTTPERPDRPPRPTREPDDERRRP